MFVSNVNKAVNRALLREKSNIINLGAPNFLRHKHIELNFINFLYSDTKFYYAKV